jgi:hypothetical protein
MQGALFNLGHEIARSTIADILGRNGIEEDLEGVRQAALGPDRGRGGSIVWAAVRGPMT